MLMTRSKFVAPCGVLTAILLFTQGMAAQSEGNNAITSNTTGSIVASTAYIDASPFFSLTQNSSDICLTINYILTSTVPSGATTGKVVVTTPTQTLTSNVNFRVTK